MAKREYYYQDCLYIEQALNYYLELLQRQTMQNIDYEQINDIKLLIQKTQDNIKYYQLRSTMIDSQHLKNNAFKFK